MRSPLILFGGLVLATNLAQAQETPQPPSVPVTEPAASTEPELSLEELQRRARDNSPRLGIAKYNLTAARERSQSLRSWPSPTLQLTPGFSGNREARDEEVILAQPLDVFGLRRARAGVAAANTRRAEAENNLAARTLFTEVRYAATALFAAQEAEQLEQAQFSIATQFRDAAARRAELGDVPSIQVQRAELEMLRAQNQFAAAQTERLTRRATLNLLIGQEPATPLRVASPLAVARVTTDTASLQVRPDIQSALAGLEARHAEARAIRREALPSVEFQARRSAFFGREGSYALRAVVTVPLFDFGSLRGERRAVEAEALAQEAGLKLLQQQAAAQVEGARLRLEQQRQNAARYKEELLPLALDLLRKAQIGYAQGASTYLEVLDAQRSLRQIQTEYLATLIGVQNSETALDAALRGGTQPIENRTENSAAGGAAR